MNKCGSKDSGIILAAKVAPEVELLSDVVRSGIAAAELYLSAQIMRDSKHIIKICKDFPLKYSVHAPNDDYNPGKLAVLVEEIKAEAVVFHNICWDGEWDEAARAFKGIKTRICVENIFSVHEPVKFERRYGWGRCLDLEHLQMECCGIYEEEFINAIKRASYIHLTGYVFGSQLWHTHLHHSKQHSVYMLNLLKKAAYKGFVVSEARCSLQNYKEFKKLNDFFNSWSVK